MEKTKALEKYSLCFNNTIKEYTEKIKLKFSKKKIVSEIKRRQATTNNSERIKNQQKWHN